MASAYDAVAVGYNESVGEDQWMRSVLWRHYERIFRAGDRVLDVACGTGLDTLHLAARGVRMTGIDLSPGMLRVLAAEARRLDLADRLKVQTANAADLAVWPGKYFHGIISGFAGLNTVRDLGGFSSDAARLLLPRGRMIVHLLAPGDFWERRQRFQRQGRQAALRYFHQRYRSKTIAGMAIRHRVITSSEVYHRYFEPLFELKRRYGLGFLLPQSVMGRLPDTLARVLGRVEAILGAARPILYRSRFFVLDMESRVESL